MTLEEALQVGHLLRPGLVAEILDLGDPDDPSSGVRAFYELSRGRSKRRLPTIKVGKYVRVRPEALRKWLEENST